jgi:hypothetical protein
MMDFSDLMRITNDVGVDEQMENRDKGRATYSHTPVQPRSYSSYTMALTSGKARCWCSCELRRSGSTTSSSSKDYRTSSVLAGDMRRDSRLWFTSSLTAAHMMTSETVVLVAALLDDTVFVIFEIV